MDHLKVTLLKRYDVNGAWTHDMDIKLGHFRPDKNSMWKVFKIVNVVQLLEGMQELEGYVEGLEEECENLTEQNRLLEIRIKELTKK